MPVDATSPSASRTDASLDRQREKDAPTSKESRFIEMAIQSIEKRVKELWNSTIDIHTDEFNVSMPVGPSYLENKEKDAPLVEDIRWSNMMLTEETGGVSNAKTTPYREYVTPTTLSSSQGHQLMQCHYNDEMPDSGLAPTAVLENADLQIAKQTIPLTSAYRSTGVVDYGQFIGFLPRTGDIKSWTSPQHSSLIWPLARAMHMMQGFFAPYVPGQAMQRDVGAPWGYRLQGFLYATCSYVNYAKLIAHPPDHITGLAVSNPQTAHTYHMSDFIFIPAPSELSRDAAMAAQLATIFSDKDIISYERAWKDTANAPLRCYPGDWQSMAFANNNGDDAPIYVLVTDDPQIAVLSPNVVGFAPQQVAGATAITGGAYESHKMIATIIWKWLLKRATWKEFIAACLLWASRDTQVFCETTEINASGQMHNQASQIADVPEFSSYLPGAESWIIRMCPVPLLVADSTVGSLPLPTQAKACAIQKYVILCYEAMSLRYQVPWYAVTCMVLNSQNPTGHICSRQMAEEYLATWRVIMSYFKLGLVTRNYTIPLEGLSVAMSPLDWFLDYELDWWSNVPKRKPLEVRDKRGFVRNGFGDVGPQIYVTPESIGPVNISTILQFGWYAAIGGGVNVNEDPIRGARISCEAGWSSRALPNVMLCRAIDIVHMAAVEVPAVAAPFTNVPPRPVLYTRVARTDISELNHEALGCSLVARLSSAAAGFVYGLDALYGFDFSHPWCGKPIRGKDERLPPEDFLQSGGASVLEW